MYVPSVYSLYSEMSECVDKIQFTWVGKKTRILKFYFIVLNFNILLDLRILTEDKLGYLA